MPDSKRTIGSRGEQIAMEYLQTKGYRLVERNFFIRGGEIDLICERSDGKLAFVEVKYRRDDRYGKPYESVTRTKIRHLSKTIQLYLLQKGSGGRKLTLEVVSILQKDMTTPPQIAHFDDLEIAL